jgi:hypothetical protein
MLEKKRGGQSNVPGRSQVTTISFVARLSKQE